MIQNYIIYWKNVYRSEKIESVKRFFTFLNKYKIRVLALLFITFSAVSSVYALEERMPSSKQEALAKITELKKALGFAKGQKRSKIIKKIAEIENKVLERKAHSFNK